MMDSTVMVADLFEREDLHVVGLVYARGRRTVTMWCSPREDPPARYHEEQPAAMVFIMSDGISAVVNPEWQKVRWFTRYVEQLTRDIHSHVDRAHVSSRRGTKTV